MDVEEELNRIVLSFCKLRRREVWKGEKGIYAIEIVKKGGKSWYVHIHALIDSKWMNKNALSDTWFNITGDSFVVDIRTIKGEKKKALREVLKYQTKMWELNDDDKEFVDMIFKGRRFIGSFGIQKPEKEKPIPMKCKCGGNLMPLEDPYFKGGGRKNWGDLYRDSS